MEVLVSTGSVCHRLIQPLKPLGREWVGGLSTLRQGRNDKEIQPRMPVQAGRNEAICTLMMLLF